MEANTPPPTVPEVLQTLVRLINDLLRKNTTMIDYYIHPRPIPTEIAAYEPRLVILRTRMQNLAQLNLNHLNMLVDDAVGLLAAYTIPNVTQLAASSASIQKIFIEHYDRRLEQCLPYMTIHESLRHYEHSLHQFHTMYFSSPRRQPAELFIPPPSPTSPSLCRGAIAFLNNRDQGKVSHVAESDLLPHQHNQLADRGGVVLWWECPTCAFQLRYHASNSTSLNINSTDEISIEEDVPDVAYRSAWLAKCHIYHPRRPKPAAPSPPAPLSPSSISPTSPTFLLSPKLKQSRPPAAPKRVSFSRRKSSSTTTTTTHRASKTRIITVEPDEPGPSSFSSHPHNRQPPTPILTSTSAPTQKRSKSKPKPKKDPSGPQGLRYFCPFCIAKGKPMVGAPPHTSSSDDASDRDQPDPTCFEDSREFMEHIDDRHTRDRPVNLLLQKLKVAVDGKVAPGPEGNRVRWDLDLR